MAITVALATVTGGHCYVEQVIAGGGHCRLPSALGPGGIAGNATGIRVRDYPITPDKLIDRLPEFA